MKKILILITLFLTFSAKSQNLDPAIDSFLKSKFTCCTSMSGDSQSLRISNDTIYISRGNFVKLPASSGGTPIVYVDSVSSNTAGDSLVVFKNGVRKAYKYPASSGGGSTVSISNTKAGNKIADVDINGLVTPINETITSIGTPTWNSTTGTFTMTYTDESGTLQTKTTTINPTFVQVDSQKLVGDLSGTVTPTLTPTTIGNTTNYVLKTDLPRATTTPNGLNNGLTYNASLGGWYVEALESAVVKMSVPPGTQQNISNGTQQTRVNVTAATQVGNTTLLTPDLANNAVKLKAGYDYEFYAYVPSEFGANTNSMTFQFVRSTTNTGTGTQFQTAASIYPMNAPSLFFQNSIPNGIYSPTVDTWVWLACINSVGANKVNTPTGVGNTGVSWTVKMIGKTY